MARVLGLVRTEAMPPQRFVTLIKKIQTTGQAMAAYAAIAEWLAANRARLLQALHCGATNHALAMLDQLCVQQPAAAALLPMLMGLDVDMAIASIGAYDIELANGLRNCISSFEELQRLWANRPAPSAEADGLTFNGGNFL
jgi:hypothetical protein